MEKSNGIISARTPEENGQDFPQVKTSWPNLIRNNKTVVFGQIAR